MQDKKTIKIKGTDVVVKELTMAEVDELLKTVGQGRAAYPAEVILDPAIPQEAVVLATGLTDADLAGDITPSELHEIWTAVAEVNGFLSKLMGRLSMEGKAGAGVSN